MSTKNAIIDIQNLSFTYPHSKNKALNGIDCRVFEGESVAVVGPNGAGKSTLAKHLIGILYAHSGTVSIDGLLVSPLNITLVRDRVGLIFQNPNDQFFCPTVQEEIEFGLINMKLPSPEIHIRVLESAKIMNIEHLLQKPAHHLSGGEKKRVAIAAILAMNPKILVMDEPTANLDPYNEKVLTDLLNTLSCTKIIISHDLPVLFQTCRRVLLIVNGRIVRDCSMQEFMYDHELILEHGLDYRFKCKCCRIVHPERLRLGSEKEDER